MLTSTVHGFILNSGAQWSGSAEVELNAPNGTGALSQTLLSVPAGNNGHFNFYNISLGVRSLTVYIPSKAAATKTVGPVLFTVDQANYGIPTALLDVGSATLFDGTRTSLNTNDYDGSVVYSFELVAQNADTIARNVSLVDATGTTKVSISIPGSTAAATRFRTGFVPTSGSSNYRLQLVGTNTASQLQVFTGRMIVKQTGATYTKIYIPMLSNDYLQTSGSSQNLIDSTTSTTYTQNVTEVYNLWKKIVRVLVLSPHLDLRGQ